MSNASNARNDGRALEAMIQGTATAYRHANVLRLEKVDPPTRVFGGRVIFMENPFADFIGGWTERGGRLLLIEAKSTSVPKLALGAKLTTKQRDWLLRWHQAGAAVGVIWEFQGACRFLPLGQIVKTWPLRKHIKWEEAEPISQGQGFVLIDFVQNLRRWYPAA